MAINFQKTIATNIVETSNKLFVTDVEKQAIKNLGTSSTRDTGINAGNLPVLDETGKLSGSILPELTITDVVGVAPIESPIFTGIPEIVGQGYILTETSNINGGYF